MIPRDFRIVRISPPASSRPAPTYRQLTVAFAQLLSLTESIQRTPGPPMQLELDLVREANELLKRAQREAGLR